MLKKLIGEIKKLIFFIRAISRTDFRHGVITNHDLNRKLIQFAPNSAGSIKGRAILTMLSAQQTFPLICELMKALEYPAVAMKQIESICTKDISILAAKQLADLFNKYGSDKSSLHNYHLIYGSILAGRHSDQVTIFEIGIGTTNIDVVSHMCQGGYPGASLRAFRDFLPNSMIYGADIDRNIIFQEERIKTFFLDQTDLNSFNEVSIALGNEKFDLIIDDGLHSPNANIATLIFALEKLKPHGWFVVEDVHTSSLPIWKVISAIIPNRYFPFICEAKNGYLFVMRNDLQ
ncbi:MAG: hypothetical protein JSW17_01145 [Candidatus Omnitrophota bacterium]|nr:MAG: hypothetical protein JSW17_01145 [Candidatus Omnitrophota bacterium]